MKKFSFYNFVPALSFVLGICSVLEAQVRKDTVLMKEVVVTSTRIPELLLETPLAISFVPIEQLKNTRSVGLSEALVSVPGVFAQSRAGAGDERITIRGFGSRGNGDRSNSATVRGIKILIDGIPETEPDGRTSLDLVDISSASSVEVLRSNASALYGMSAGGVINLTTNSSYASPFVEVGDRFGSFGFQKTTAHAGAVSGSSKIFSRFSNTTFDGYRQHSRSSNALFTAGVVATPEIDSRLSVFLTGSSTMTRIPGALTQRQFDADPTRADSVYVARDERRYNRQAKVSVQYEKNFSKEHLLKISSFVNPKVIERSERNTYRDFNRYHLGGSALYGYETNLSFGELHASVGVDQTYQDGAILFYNLQNGGRGTTIRQNKQEGNVNGGAFGQAELVTGNLSFLVGGRYDRQTLIFRDFTNDTLNAQKTYTFFTPKAGVLYRLAPAVSVYANLGGGVETPAGNETDPPDSLSRKTGINPLLDASPSTTLELGTKGILSFENFFRYISFDVAGYMISTKKEIIPFNGGAYYFNSGETERKGVEVGVNIETQANISLRTSITASSNTYKKYTNDVGTFDGNTIAGIPSLFAQARLRYKISFDFFVEVGVNHAGEMFADDANTLRNPAHTTFSALAGMPISFGAFRIDVFAGVDNLSDVKYASSVFINPVKAPSGEYKFLEPGLPRTMFGGLSITMAL